MHETPRPRAVLAALCLALAAASAPAAPSATGSAGSTAPANPAGPAVPAPAKERRPDPLLAFMLGAVPFASGYYVTASPHKGLAFTLADAVILGSIWSIRRDENLPDRDVAPYFFLLGAANAADAVLSLMQARADARTRLSVTLTPSGDPKLGLAWRF